MPHNTDLPQISTMDSSRNATDGTDKSPCYVVTNYATIIRNVTLCGQGTPSLQDASLADGIQHARGHKCGSVSRSGCRSLGDGYAPYALAALRKN